MLPLGKLWVDYDVEFFVPQKGPSGGAPSGASSTSFYSEAAAQTFATTIAEAVAWDTKISDPLSVGDGTLGVFTPPVGAYRVEAFVSVNDSTTEMFSAVLELKKNGASLPVPVKCTNHNPGTSANDKLHLSLGGLILASGTDTFQVDLTLTGAAGTLTTVADSCQLLVSPA